ncbi:MAG: cyclase family protein [Novosphingobium sp.]|nr:cyclase family protein [Novosphingobium sp.]
MEREARWLADFRRIVTEGRIVELGHILHEDIPNSPNHPPFMFRLTKLHNDARIGSSDVSASSDMFTMGSHNGTHIDALNHIACCGMVYPERDSDEVATRRDGYIEHGIEAVEPLFVRGVLLDLPALLGVESLPPAFDVSRAHLETACARQGVEIRAGDAVLIRCGWERYWTDHRKYVGVREGSPGPDREAAAWLGDQGIRVTGADTFAYDKRPSSMPAHVELMVRRGINIMENMRLDELAASGRSEFLFCALPLRIQGGTGSPIRPVAFL